MLLEPFGGPGRRLPAQPGSSNKWVARGTISSRQIDDLEPALTRHGYDVRTLADRFNVKPIEIKALLAGNPARRAYPRADRSHERRWGPRMKSCRINKERCRVRVSARAFVARFEVFNIKSPLRFLQRQSWKHFPHVFHLCPGHRNGSRHVFRTKTKMVVGTPKRRQAVIGPETDVEG
jgi:hypothetical protein